MHDFGIWRLALMYDTPANMTEDKDDSGILMRICQRDKAVDISQDRRPVLLVPINFLTSIHPAGTIHTTFGLDRNTFPAVFTLDGPPDDTIMSCHLINPRNSKQSECRAKEIENLGDCVSPDHNHSSIICLRLAVVSART